MQTLDAITWSKQEQELQADEASRTFLKFFTAWFTAAETLYDEWDETRTIKPRLRVRTLPQAVRQALVGVETDQGALSMEWIGQMLLLAREHWIHGSDLMVGLTRLEKRMMEQMEAIKLAALQEQAATL